MRDRKKDRSVLITMPESQEPLNRDLIVEIVREVNAPNHRENHARLKAIEDAQTSDRSQMTQMSESISVLRRNDANHDMRVTRIESNIEALVGSASITGMIPKLSAELQKEFALAHDFYHRTRGVMDSMLGRMTLIEQRTARDEGECEGEDRVKKRVADWVKWLAGGIGSAAGLLGMDLLKHYFLHWK